MAVSFEWKHEYSIGVEEIDYQHKRFLSFINQINELGHNGADASETLEVLNELEKYLLFHTKSEEFMMDVYSYPQKEVQEKEHTRIMQEVRSKIDNLSDNSDSLNELLGYLLVWFKNHTTSLDRAFGEYIKQKRGGLKMEPGLS
jgi:hemerythrin